MLEDIEGLLRAFDHQPTRRRIKIRFHVHRRLTSGGRLEHPRRPSHRDGGVGRIDHEVTDLPIDATGLINKRDGLSNGIEVPRRACRDQALAIGARHQLDHRRLPGCKDCLTGLNRRFWRCVIERKQDDGRRAGIIRRPTPLKVSKESGRLLDQYRICRNSQAIGFLKFDVGRLLFLGEAPKERIEFGPSVAGGDAIELNSPHRHHRTDLLGVKKVDGATKPFKPSRRTSRDDRISSIVGGNPKADGHHVFFDLDLRFPPSHGLDHSLAHEFQERRE